MKKSNSIKRTMSFMLIFSIVYTVFEGNLLFLTPILTVLIPFRFMKNKENTDKDFFDNQKTLTRLLLFNFICIELVSLVTQNGNYETFNISVMMLIYLLYFKMLSFNEKKVLTLKNNPQAVYEKMKLKIDTLESVYNKGLEELENTEDEKVKMSMKSKLDKLNVKINASKKQLAMIESIINSDKNSK
ncbi:hypothetical protein [Paeniclostridium hominis]|uniref:hypothetical protein n=1 Tax=Paeniclostridium hominis TaxID=2764329 RepID=UPI0022E7827F|nr:hypothetical protein [Paeniclostridium hominis]